MFACLEDLVSNVDQVCGGKAGPGLLGHLLANFISDAAGAVLATPEARFLRGLHVVFEDRGQRRVMTSVRVRVKLDRRGLKSPGQ